MGARHLLPLPVLQTMACLRMAIKHLIAHLFLDNPLPCHPTWTLPILQLLFGISHGPKIHRLEPVSLGSLDNSQGYTRNRVHGSFEALIASLIWGALSFLFYRLSVTGIVSNVPYFKQFYPSLYHVNQHSHIYKFSSFRLHLFHIDALSIHFSKQKILNALTLTKTRKGMCVLWNG